MRSLLLLAPLALLTGERSIDVAAVSPQEAAATPEQQLAALIARFDKQQSYVYAIYEKATTQAEREKIWAGRPGKEYVPEFRAIAESAAGTETAAKAWLRVLRLIGDDSCGPL